MVRSERIRARGRSIRPSWNASHTPGRRSQSRDARSTWMSATSTGQMQSRLHFRRSRLEHVLQSRDPPERPTPDTDSDTDWMSAYNRRLKMGDHPSISLQQPHPVISRQPIPIHRGQDHSPTTTREESSPDPPAAHRRHPTPHREHPTRKSRISASNICSTLQPPQDRFHTFVGRSEKFLRGPRSDHAGRPQPGDLLDRITQLPQHRIGVRPQHRRLETD